MSEVKLRPQLGMFDAISTGMAAIWARVSLR